MFLLLSKGEAKQWFFVYQRWKIANKTTEETKRVLERHFFLSQEIVTAYGYTIQEHLFTVRKRLLFSGAFDIPKRESFRMKSQEIYL